MPTPPSLSRCVSHAHSQSKPTPGRGRTLMLMEQARTPLRDGRLLVPLTASRRTVRPSAPGPPRIVDSALFVSLCLETWPLFSPHPFLSDATQRSRTSTPDEQRNALPKTEAAAASDDRLHSRFAPPRFTAREPPQSQARHPGRWARARTGEAKKPTQQPPSRSPPCCQRNGSKGPPSVRHLQAGHTNLQGSSCGIGRSDIPPPLLPTPDSSIHPTPFGQRKAKQAGGTVEPRQGQGQPVSDTTSPLPAPALINRQANLHPKPSTYIYTLPVHGSPDSAPSSPPDFFRPQSAKTSLRHFRHSRDHSLASPRSATSNIDDFRNTSDFKAWQLYSYRLILVRCLDHSSLTCRHRPPWRNQRSRCHPSPTCWESQMPARLPTRMARTRDVSLLNLTVSDLDGRI